MIINIKHGRPNSSFFIVAYPKCNYDEPRIDTKEKPNVELEDPDDATKIIKAQLWDIWTMEEKDFKNCDGLARLAYGCSAEFLKKNMMEKYPQLNKEFIVEYWLLKRL